ncbi:phage terminase large subunit [Mucilaginibacter sp. AW1-3]
MPTTKAKSTQKTQKKKEPKKSAADDSITSNASKKKKGSSFRKTGIQNRALKIFKKTAREFLLVGGSRSGKSFIIVYQQLAMAIKYDGSRHLIARFRFNHAKNSIWLDTLKKVLKLAYPGVKVTWRNTDYYLELENGSQIWLAGLDDKDRTEKILGMEFLTVFLNEASQISYEAYTILKTRLAQKIGRARPRLFVDANPPSKKHWMYQVFYNNNEPETNTTLVESRYAYLQMNPIHNKKNINAEYLETLNSLPLRKRKRFLDGEFADDSECALWTDDLINATRLRRLPDGTLPVELKRIVIAVDPAVTSKDTSDETGNHGIEIVECNLADIAKNEKNDKLKLQAQLKYLNDKHNIDIANAGTDAKLKNKIDEQYLADKQQLNEAYLKVTKKTFQGELKLIDQKAQHYQQHFSKLSGLFAKNTQVSKAAFAAQKAIATAEIAINTEKQVSASISATKNQIAEDSKLSFPLGTILVVKDIVLGAIDVASTIANGAKQVASINGTNPPGFARGGMYLSDGYGAYLTGPGTGTSDSINAKLSNGESIINARSTEMFAPILSAINMAGGGRAFGTTTQGNGYALGGLFNGSNTLNDGSNDFAVTRATNDMVKTIAANMPRQILVVEDVQASLQNKAMLQNMSNF